MIPKKEAEIYVGSAGTAARFLTAMLALSEGVYTIQASAQMKRRPMRPLFEALEQSGAEFTYLEKRRFSSGACAWKTRMVLRKHL